MSSEQPKNSEFAPMYSRRERWRKIRSIALILIPIAVIFFGWLLPWLNTFLLSAHCQTVLGFNGLTLIMALMLALPPLLLALFLIVTEGPKSWQVYQLRQTPLPGEKVMKPTPYRYRTRALLRPIALLVIILLLVFFAVWSLWMVNQFSERISERADNCHKMTLVSHNQYF